MTEPVPDDLMGHIYDIVIEVPSGTILTGDGEKKLAPAMFLLAGQMHILSRRQDMEEETNGK